MSLQRIVLTGFMGSGKTTVGRLLAARLGWAFCDLDREVERLAASSVPALFAARGEAHFRQLEAEALTQLLGREQMVLALGGGAPEFPATYQLLRSATATRVVYLAAPFPRLTERCEQESKRPEAVARPLFRDLQSAEERFRRREPLYQGLAHLMVQTGELGAEDVMHALLDRLAEESPSPG